MVNLFCLYAMVTFVRLDFFKNAEYFGIIIKIGVITKSVDGECSKEWRHLGNDPWGGFAVISGCRKRFFFFPQTWQQNFNSILDHNYYNVGNPIWSFILSQHMLQRIGLGGGRVQKDFVSSFRCAECCCLPEKMFCYASSVGLSTIKPPAPPPPLIWWTK